MATAYAVNSRLLRGFCASGPKSIAHKRSFGKSPAPAEGRFPGVFSRSGQGWAAVTARPDDRDVCCGWPTAGKGRARQAQPGGHPRQEMGGHSAKESVAGAFPLLSSIWAHASKPHRKGIRTPLIPSIPASPSARGRLPAPGRQATVRPCVQKSPASARINWSSCRAWPKAVNRPAVSSWPAR